MPLDLKPKYDASKCAWKHCRQVENLSLFSRLPTGQEIWLCPKHKDGHGVEAAVPATQLALPATQDVSIVPAGQVDIVSLNEDSQDAFEAWSFWKGANIDGEEDLKLAAELLSEVKGRYKRYEEQKQSITKPLNDSIKKVRDLFADVQNNHSQLESLLKQRMAEYSIRIAQQRQEALKAIEDSATSEQVGMALQQLSIAAEPDKIKGLSQREVLDFEVMDESLIPRQFLAVDMSKIRHAVQAGLEIPGVRTFTKIVIASRAS